MKVTAHRLFESIVKNLKEEICGEDCGEKVWFWLFFSIWESFINLEKINKDIFKYICYNGINEKS